MVGATLDLSNLADPRSLICTCANDTNPQSLGFKPSTISGDAPLLPDSATHLLCINCFAIIDPTSKQIVAFATTGYAFEEWELSPPSDCENCGYSQDALAFRRKSDGSYRLRATLGCFTTRDFLIDHLGELDTFLQRFPYFNEQMKSEILLTIEDYKGKVGA